MEVSRSWGQNVLRKGVISWWLNSVTTTIRSPGSPGSSPEGKEVGAGVLVGVMVAVGGTGVFVGVLVDVGTCVWVAVGGIVGDGVVDGVGVGVGSSAGLIDTAPMAQGLLHVHDHDIVTDEAPASVLPPAVGSPWLFHLCV